MHKSFTKRECFCHSKHKWNITDTYRCLGVASSFPQGGKIFIQSFEWIAIEMQSFLGGVQLA